MVLREVRINRTRSVINREQGAYVDDVAIMANKKKEPTKIVKRLESAAKKVENMVMSRRLDCIQIIW